MRNKTALAVIGAALALIVQLVIAPNIALGHVVPNLLIVFTVFLSIMRPQYISTLVIAFSLGLLYDFLGHGPVGAMALLSVLAYIGIYYIFKVIDNESVSMPLIVFFVAVLFVEFLYAVFMILLGVSIGILEAFVFTALPCALYDFVFGVLLIIFGGKLFMGSETRLSDSSNREGGAVQVSAHMPPKTSPLLRSKATKRKTPRF